MPKFIFVTGGVVSGLGKGITAASLGRLLKARGYKVASQKLDPYINVDPGTISPYEHGEAFVTQDGAETDLDIGHYERFIDEDLNKYSNITTGKVYWSVLNKEREGKYLGETVQIIPHITNEIKDFVYRVGKQTQADIVITEIGGTIGDIESQPYLEAIRQISHEQGRDNCIFIHVTLVPYISGSDEYKSKPTQHSVKQMRETGLQPNIIVCRCDKEIPESIRAKIAMFCDVKPDCVINNVTVPELYEAPIMLEKDGFSDVVCRELHMEPRPVDLSEWNEMLCRIHNRKKTVKVALVGKYVQLHDAYLSVVEALSHAGYENGAKIDIQWTDSEQITEDKLDEFFGGVDAIIVPGGFGDREIDGLVLATRYAREKNVPFLGICLGMHIAVIEYARNVLGYADASSREFDAESKRAVIDILPDQNGEPLVRMGAYPCAVKRGTLLEKIYGEGEVAERHRHKYEFNNLYRYEFETKGMVFSGASPDDKLVEAVEIPANSFFVAVQYHPEFKSRPNRAHPLFREFVAAAIEQKEN